MAILVSPRKLRQIMWVPTLGKRLDGLIIGAYFGAIIGIPANWFGDMFARQFHEYLGDALLQMFDSGLLVLCIFLGLMAFGLWMAPKLDYTLLVGVKFGTVSGSLIGYGAEILIAHIAPVRQVGDLSWQLGHSLNLGAILGCFTGYLWARHRLEDKKGSGVI